MVHWEVAVCGAVELYCIISVSIIIISALIDINGLGIILETPLGTMQHNLQ